LRFLPLAGVQCCVCGSHRLHELLVLLASLHA
jgi:hypothetical protein